MVKDTRYARSGIPIVAEREFFLCGKYNKLYVHPFKEHTAIIGPSGAGKTQTIVYPLLQTILDAEESAVIHDCKMELLDHFGPKFKEAGYNVIVLNFNKPLYSHRWNPFGYPIKKWKETLDKYNLSYHDFRKVKSKGLSEAIEKIKDISMTLCYEEDNDKNSFFWKGAGSMMAGAAFLLLEEGKYDCINGKGIRMVYKMKSDNPKDKHETLHNFIKQCRGLDDDSVIQTSVFFDADGVTRGNISSTFEQKVEVLGLTPDIQYLTSASDFDMEDIYKQKTAVFILTQDEKSIYYPLVTVFLKQLYEVGVKLTRDGGKRQWEIPMNWVVEEMGVLPEIKDITNIYNASKARGLTIYAFFQAMSDMEDKYEYHGARTMLENMPVQILLRGETPEAKKYFQERCKTALYFDKKDKQFKERNVVNDQQLALNEKGRFLVTIAGQHPYIAKLPPYTDYSFYKEPDRDFLKKIFGENGRSYSYDDIKWFENMKQVTELYQEFKPSKKRKKKTDNNSIPLDFSEGDESSDDFKDESKTDKNEIHSSIQNLYQI